MIGPSGGQGPAATLRQHCPQMTRRRCMYVVSQVLRDEIGTAMTNKSSRADQFSLIIHGQDGEVCD